MTLCSTFSSVGNIIQFHICMFFHSFLYFVSIFLYYRCIIEKYYVAATDKLRLVSLAKIIAKVIAYYNYLNLLIDIEVCDTIFRTLVLVLALILILLALHKIFPLFA